MVTLFKAFRGRWMWYVTKQGDIASEEIDKMSYIVRHESEVSTLFCALIGIIIGDTPSPILWTIYLSEFKLLSEATTDILLAGVFITNAEQANDVILIS
jgi:hypothetical protein